MGGPASVTLPEVVVRAPRAEPNGRLPLDLPVDTASRLGLTPRETPASVTLIERATIERRDDRDTHEILRGVPGVTAAAPPGGAGFVSYRGFTGSQITQLFNGISVQYDTIAARPTDSWIHDRVEVVGGPSSFLYGAGAVGGSINTITRLASRASARVDALARIGSFGTGQLAAGVNRQLSGGQGGPSSWLRADLSHQRTDGWVEGASGRATTAAVSVLTDLTSGLTHTLALQWQRETRSRPYWGTPLLTPTTGTGRIDPGTRRVNYNAADGAYEQTVRWARSILDYRVSSATTLRNTLYHYDARRDYRNVEVYRFAPGNATVVRSSPFLQRHDQSLVGDRLELGHESTLAGRPSQWAVGLDVSLNRQTRFPRSSGAVVSTVDPYDPVVEPFFSIPGMAPIHAPDRDHSLRTMAVFLENRTRLTPAVALVTALRHDRIALAVQNRRAVTATDPARFDRTFDATTGRAGLVWDLTSTTSVYGQVSTAADPPAGILTTATFSQLRDFDLSRGRQAEAGTKLSFWNGRANATVALYAIERRNLSVVDPANPGTTVPVGRQSSRGLEIALGMRATERLTLQGNLARVEARFDEFTENVGGVAVSRAGNRPANVPAWVANLWADWRFATDWSAQAGVRLVSRAYADAANTVAAPGYGVIDASVAYALSRNLVVVARVRNLSDTVYAANVTGTPMFFLGEPRSAELSLRASF